jgi:ABC-type branched-subunit amino acid transport system substrate-binding protein
MYDDETAINDNPLDRDSAKNLIGTLKPVLEYEEKAIEEILQLSGGHPYFIKVICSTVSDKVQKEGKGKVTTKDVEDQNIVNGILTKEQVKGDLTNLWDRLSIPQKVILSAVAEAQEIVKNNKKTVLEEPLTRLKSYGVSETIALKEAEEQLVKRKILTDKPHKVQVELVRQWLVKEHQLQNEIKGLEKLEEESVNNLVSQGNDWYDRGLKRKAFEYYDLVLKDHPNHFSTLLSLAPKYLEAKKFEKALEVYSRSYKFFQKDTERKTLLLQAHKTYGLWLIEQKKFTKAEHQFREILKIDPNNKDAKTNLKKIQNYSRIIPAAFASSVSVLLLTFLVFSFLNKDEIRISRGERSLEFEYKNLNSKKELNEGYKHFEKNEYSEAEKIFCKASKEYPHPAVLIYCNNARAKKSNNTITLAAVVPIKREQGPGQAEEMLRGIAQAQDQFNIKQKNGQGPLLEIVIADDENNPKKATQVARKLVKDSSVLGVIGHNSSGATQAGIKEYKEAKLAIVSPTSGSIHLNPGDNKVFFRTLPSDQEAGKRLAEYAAQTSKTSVIFYTKDDKYSESMREAFTKKFENLGGKVLKEPGIDLKSLSIDVKTEFRQVTKEAETVILFPDTENIDLALKIAEANQLGLQLFGGHSLYTEKTLKDGGKNVEGLIIETPWFRDDPKAKDFANQAKKLWGADINWRTATSFDATQAFIKAIDSSSNTRETILKRLGKVNIPADQTSGYPLEFEEGERKFTPGACQHLLVKVENKKFVLLEDSLKSCTNRELEKP